jgi:hypothetical protein
MRPATIIHPVYPFISSTLLFVKSVRFSASILKKIAGVGAE